MSGCLNKAILIGRLGSDVELNHTKGGTAVANVNIATERRVKSGDKWELKTVWLRLVMWGKTAENAAQYLGKGSLIYVEGELDFNEWTDKEGLDRKDIQVVCNNVVYLQSKGDGKGKGGSKREDPPPPDDDDIPF